MSQLECCLLFLTFQYPLNILPVFRYMNALQVLIREGLEILSDPKSQRFQDQVAEKDAGDDEAMHYDADYIRALEYGMPPTSGMGIGMDRLIMFLTNNSSIQEVLFFPQMKPEKKAISLSENEKAVFDILKLKKEIQLSELKAQSGLSNKGWDKGIKGLTSKELAKVQKIDEILIVSILSD